MLLGVLLILPLYAMVLGIFWRFRRLIKAMTEIEEIFADCSAEEETFQEEPSKQEFLIAQVDMGKADRLPGKTPWTVKRLRKGTDLVIETNYITNIFRLTSDIKTRQRGKQWVLM